MTDIKNQKSKIKNHLGHVLLALSAAIRACLEISKSGVEIFKLNYAL